MTPAILVISPDPAYLDDVTEALAEVGGFGVLVHDAEGAADALAQGFRPDAVLLDPVLIGDETVGEDVLRLLRRTHALSATPVMAFASTGPRSVAKGRRVDRLALASALQKLDHEATLD